MSKAIWQHFAEQFGVANIVPIALAREGVESDLPAGVVGKVPSVYNTTCKIVGFKNWQKGRVKASDVARWCDDSRYGFGVILGQPLPNLSGCVAVVFDMDTENKAYQERAYDIMRNACGVDKLPMRVRTNSNRRAYVFAVLPREGEQITKRVLRLPEGEGGKREAVEILGYGQQFAAFGTHPTGAEIEWLDAPAQDVKAESYWPEPALLTITHGELDKLIADISDALPIQQDTAKASRRARGAAGAQVEDDDVARYLDANGWTLDTGAEGQRHIHSPFEAEYTNEQGNGDTSVTYFLPGTHGYDQGHFVSHHASDAARTDSDFLNAIGYVASQFPALSIGPQRETAIAPSFPRNKAGIIEPDLITVLTALKAAEWLGYDVRFDEFAGALVIGGPGKWRPFKDTDYTWLRVALQAQGFKAVSRELIRDAVQAAAEVRKFDSAREWLDSLTWDGVERVETFFPRYFRTEDSEYTRAASRYVWTAHAGRVLSPGCKADMMALIVGPQGCGKSTGVAAIAPNPKLFAELSFSESDADQARKMRGVVVAEYAEMNGLRGRAMEAVKAHLTKQVDNWVPKYQENPQQFERRLVMWGTSNDEELLDDPTGARRFIPMKCGQVDVSTIKHDCAQLWAEAATLYRKHGVMFTEAQELAADELSGFRVTDDMEAALDDWLNEIDELDGSTPKQRGNVTSFDVIQAMRVKGFRIEQDRAGQIRAGKALKALGFSRRRKVFNNSLRWVYEI